MRLLDRYLLRELLTPLAYCLGGFLVFWNAWSLIDDLHRYQEAHLLLSDVIELHLVQTPAILVFLLPITLLLALLHTLTNLARHHELTAIRAAGVSLARLCLPYFAVGFCLSIAVLYMNERWVPDTAEREQQIMTRRAAKNPNAPAADEVTNTGFDNARDGRRWLFNSYNLRTHVLLDPKVLWKSPDGQSKKLLAKRAEYLDGVWTFYQVEEWTGNVVSLNANILAHPDFSETPEQIKREIQFSRHFSAMKTHAQAVEVPIVEIMDYLDLHPTGLTPRNRDWLRTQLQGRLAQPWTCLIVVIIAIPFGAGSGRRNIFMGVAGSIVICFAYIVLLKLSLASGTAGWLPAWLAAWLPNIVFGATGLWLMQRVR